MNVFDKIYKHNTWMFGSGSGSVPINNKPYIEFLKDLLANKQISSVIDIGCGDWQLAKNINWNGIKYLGIDTMAQRFGSYLNESDFTMLNMLDFFFNLEQRFF